MAISKTRVVWGALYLTLSAALLVGVRELQGSGPEPWPPEVIVRVNVDSLAFDALPQWAAFFGLWWLLMVRGWKHAPPLLRAFALASVGYVVMTLIYGRWVETRLIVPMLPVWVALALVAGRAKKF